MKKVFTLLTLLLCVCSGAWAADYVVTATRTIKSDNKTSEWSTISVNNGSAIQNGATALGEGIYFVAADKSKITAGGQQINVKANALMYLEVPNGAAGSVTIVDGNDASRYFETLSGAKLYMKTNNTVNFTSADIEKIDGVTYLKLTSKSDNKFYGVKIVLTTGTYAVLTKLSAPTIGDLASGKVNISVPTNASSVSYTLDGTMPSATNGTIITTSTDVEITEDNVTVQAIAIGDGVSYSNSAIVSKVIYQPNVTCATPVITAINGTINITCATGGATVKYSTDGTNYSDFTLPQTFFTNTTVYAKAVREGATDSKVATLEVEAAPAAAAGSQTKILFYTTSGNWEEMKSGSTAYGIQGKTGTDDEGWSVWISPNSSEAYDKALTTGNTTYTIDNTEYTYLKGSNGRQTNIGLPAGATASRITIYSFNNGSFDGTSLWSLVGGTTFTEETEIALQSTAGSTPDVRVFTLDDVEGTITLNNNGKVQQCFIAVVDYSTSTCSKPTITVGDFTFADKGYPVTITSNDNLLVSTDGTTYTQQTSPYNTTVTATTTFYAKATATGKDDSEVASQEVTCNFDSSKKFVAWVYTKGYGAKSYAFATDPMVAALQNDYNVVEVNNATDVAPAADLANADLIVSTEAMTGNKNLSNGMKAFVGVTPMIGLKAFNYTKGRWSWGTPSNPGSTAQSFAPKSANFKLFDNVEFESDGTVKLATATSGNVIQTVEFGTTECTAPEGNIILGTLGGDDKKAVMYASNKYFGLGLSSDCWDSYTNNAITIVKNAAAMLINGVGLDATNEIATISKSISDAGYATLYSQYPLDFSGSGLTAYIATIEGNTVTFESKTSIPALTGVLLKGDAGVHNITVAESNTDVSANKFKGVIANTEVDAGIYVLMNINNVVGFYQTKNAFTVGANTAYLPADVMAEARAFISLDGDEATGIAEVKGSAAEQQVYDLQGRRVAQPVKGLYIVNGRKVVVK